MAVPILPVFSALMPITLQAELTTAEIPLSDAKAMTFNTNLSF